MSDPPEPSAVIWRWREQGDARARRAKKQRRAGVIRFVVAMVAGGLFLFFGKPAVATAAFSVGSLTLVLALVSPLGAYAALDRLIGKLGELIGTVLTWLLLAPVFYLFFAPFRWLFRRGKKDPLVRRFEADRPSYWTKREAERPLDRPY